MTFQMGEDEVLTRENNIVKFTVAISETANVTHKEPAKQQQQGSFLFKFTTNVRR
jgi:hypothetical protein